MAVATAVAVEEDLEVDEDRVVVELECVDVAELVVDEEVDFEDSDDEELVVEEVEDVLVTEDTVDIEDVKDEVVALASFWATAAAERQ